MTDWWRKPRKWNIPLTYEPKIAGVRWGVPALRAPTFREVI